MIFSFGDAVFGGVIADNVPQPGEQFAPPAVSVQVTPAFVKSLLTTAFKVIIAPPVNSLENLFVMLTVTCCGGGCPPPD